MTPRSYDGAPLVRLLYTSRSALDSSAPDHDASIRRLVAEAARANAGRNVTGAIMLVRGTFIQVLEGELETVEEVFELICRDLRHTHVRLAELAPSDVRLFFEWSMVLIGSEDDEIDFVRDHALDDIYQSLSVSPSFALKKMRGLLSASGDKAA